jgi:hypothetical protein
LTVNFNALWQANERRMQMVAIDDAVLVLGPDGAHGPFLETGAVVQCAHHPEIFVRIHDAEKERSAYGLADGRVHMLPPNERQAVKNSMAASLDTMADRHCPVCEAAERVV